MLSKLRRRSSPSTNPEEQAEALERVAETLASRRVGGSFRAVNRPGLPLRGGTGSARLQPGDGAAPGAADLHEVKAAPSRSLCAHQGIPFALPADSPRKPWSKVILVRRTAKTTATRDLMCPMILPLLRPAGCLTMRNSYLSGTGHRVPSLSRSPLRKDGKCLNARRRHDG